MMVVNTKNMMDTKKQTDRLSRIRQNEAASHTEVYRATFETDEERRVLWVTIPIQPEFLKNKEQTDYSKTPKRQLEWRFRRDFG